MKTLFLILPIAFVLCGPLRGQSIFDSSVVHEVKITSLYSGLTETLTTDYLLSFDFLRRQIRDIPYTYCKIELDGKPLDTIGIRHKGFNSWWSSPKKPMKLDLNRFKNGQNYQGLKKLNLHNRASDPTFMRENLCYELLRKMGIPAPRTAFAKVYFDGVYAGLYRLVEEVDNDFLDAHFGDHKGNLFKQNSSGSAGYTLSWLGNKPENYYPQFQLENHRSENDWSKLVRFIDLLNNTPDPVFADSIAAVFNVQSFLSVLALDLAVNNLDFYGNSGRNYFLYHDAGGDGKFHWLPWDYNLSWRDNLPPLEPELPSAPVLIKRLLAAPQFRQTFLEQYCVLLQYFDPARLNARMEIDSALIRPALATDPSGDYALADFEQNIAAPWFNLAGLKPFLNQRRAEIDLFLQDKAVNCSLVPTDDPEPGERASLVLYPNPARGQITLQWPELFAPAAKQVQVFDVLGHLVKSEKAPAGDLSHRVDLSGLSPGLYFIRVTSGRQRLEGKCLLVGD